MLSSFSLASVSSLLHASVHRRFGRPLLLFPGMSTSSIILNMCSSFILLTWPSVSLQSCFRNFHVRLHHSFFVPLMWTFRIFSITASQHPHLFTPSRASCSGCNKQHPHWHPPVTQHATTPLPVSPCCTHSLWNFSPLSFTNFSPLSFPN